jgi:hypothetical protein
MTNSGDKHKRASGKKGAKEADAPRTLGITCLEDIAQALKLLRFKKALIGADERDVWAKLRRLDEMYAALYQAQELKYRALLEEREEIIKRYSDGLNFGGNGDEGHG